MKKNQVKKSLNFIPFSGVVFATIFVNIIIAVVVVLAQNILPPVIPLFYGQPQGFAQLANKIWLLAPVVTSLVITLINVAIAKSIKSIFVQKVLIGLGVVVTTLSTITVIKIIFLVGNI